MRKLVLSFVILVLLSATIGMNLWAEDIKFPQPSPKAIITQTVGLTDITIEYHRPSVKDRTIWGDLVPWDKNWRTGANEATLIKFSTDVTIGDKKVSKGEYALFTIPGKAEWTFIISKQTKIWGNMGYKDSEDVVRVKAKSAAAPHCESMSFGFDKLTENSAMVYLHWEKVMVGFDVKVDTHNAVLASVKKAMGGYWVPPYRAANYAMGKDMMDKAKKFISMSTAIKKVYWNLLLKAKIYKKFLKAEKDKKMAKKYKKKVIMILEAAIASVKELPEGQQKYVAGNPEAEKMLKKFKAKK
jgi:DUF2911 family protein